MIYSLWNQATHAYDYYQTPEVQDRVNTPAPKHLPNIRARLGVSPVRAGWPLPANAVKVGSGLRAQGRVASKGGGSAFGDFLGGMEVGTMALWGLAGFFAWKTLK